MHFSTGDDRFIFPNFLPYTSVSFRAGMDASSLSVAPPQGQAVFRTGASQFGNVSPDTLIADFLPTLGMMAISLFLG